MRIAGFLIVLAFSVHFSSSARGAELDGQWLGYEPRSSLSPDEKDTEWFYENRLTIANGVIRLSKLPVWRSGKQKQFTYSASDGGFPVFKGRLEIHGEAMLARLEIESCDYCGQVRDNPPQEHKAWGMFGHVIERQGEPKDYPITVVGQTITLDRVTFHRVSKFPN